MSATDRKIGELMRAATVLAAASLSACGGNLYLQGAETIDASARSSILKPNPENGFNFFYRVATPIELDGELIRHEINEIEVFFPGGQHDVSIRYMAKDELLKIKRAFGHVAFIAEAGRRYRVAARENFPTVTFWIEDIDSGERVSEETDAVIEELSDGCFTCM